MLRSSAPARIIHVAAAGLPGKLDLAQVPPKAEASSFTGHNLGQRANDVYGIELAARLQGSGVTINIMNPGMVDTDIRRSSPDARWLLRIVEWLMHPWATSPEQFAQHVVRWATDPTLATTSGQLVGSNGQPIRIPAQRQESALRAALWRKSAVVTGVEAKQEAVYAR